MRNQLMTLALTAVAALLIASSAESSDLIARAQVLQTRVQPVVVGTTINAVAVRPLALRRINTRAVRTSNALLAAQLQNQQVLQLQAQRSLLLNTGGARLNLQTVLLQDALAQRSALQLFRQAQSVNSFGRVNAYTLGVTQPIVIRQSLGSCH